ncbi:MAG TPA: hypothetical protein DD808_18430 [Halieaceae bacterium]|uniref:hypothetical protein n=1 Tax=Haliea sp. TaxID=1932666 RepID=UPI000C591476|nr:hypothetical protein [Haliea sp.]HAN69555.1 hypothetical protein [Halieaceae bacterium]MAD65273.1 hypothetical protein [Haliea sp.]MAY92727.1 hypothetical protein [Haliea sp.]MBP70723.1 hypothetical protein [Haliea sp.]HBQ42520.1 hypothetical protein [Halieaceae bacterium]
MVDVFLVMVLLMAGLTWTNGDPDAPAAERRQSDAPITEGAAIERENSPPCATPGPHWRDLSTLDLVVNSGAVREEGATDAR